MILRRNNRLPSPQRSLNGWWTVALLVAVQIGLALPYLETVPRYYNDEAWEASLGDSLASEGVLRHGFLDGRGGMHVRFVQNRVILPLVCAPIFRAAGVSITTSRLGSVLMSGLAVACVYGVARRLYGKKLAVWIALATILFPWFFEISRRVRPEIHYLALGMAAWWCLLRAGESRRKRSALAAGALAGLASLAHPTGIVLVLAIACAVGFWHKETRSFRVLFWTGAGYAAALLPYAVYVLWAVQHPRVNFFIQMRGPQPVTSFDLAVILGREVQRWAHFFQWPRGAPLCAMVVAAWLAAWYRSTRSDKSVATAIGVFAVLLPFVNVNTTSRYLVALAPLLCILIVRLVDRCVRPIGQNRPTKRGLGIGLGVAAVYLIMAVTAIGLMFARLRHAEWSRVAARVGSVVGPESRVYGPPVLWMAGGHYRYAPYPLTHKGIRTLRKIARHRPDYAVRSAWTFEASNGIASPPRNMPGMRFEIIDLVCQSVGEKVAEFRDPHFGPFEVYKLNWDRKALGASRDQD